MLRANQKFTVTAFNGDGHRMNGLLRVPYSAAIAYVTGPDGSSVQTTRYSIFHYKNIEKFSSLIFFS